MHRPMMRTLAPITLVLTGAAIVALSVLLYRQSVQIARGNLSAETHLAQFVLQDVIGEVAAGSPNGIKPEEAAGPLKRRVAIYSLCGIVLVSLGGWLLANDVAGTSPAV